jgi:hypothetical protein
MAAPSGFVNTGTPQLALTRPRSASLLKIELQRELDLSRGPREIGRLPSARNRAHGWRANRCVRVIELGRIEEIESLHAELQISAPVLGNVRVLFEIQINLVRDGTS